MKSILNDILTYDADGRAPLAELNGRYDEFESKYGFAKEPIYTVSPDAAAGQSELTAYCYRSAKTGPSAWILSGVHGEEPAGPNAIARNSDNLGLVGQEIPVIIMPLLNPAGYCRDWRYPDERRDWRIGHSVGDSEHYLPNLQDPTRPRVALPRSEIAARVTQYVLDKIMDYPPVLTIDLHEDEQLERGYIYSQGPRAARDAAAREVIRLLAASGMPLAMQGLTRFGERITEGVVGDQEGQPVKDGSLDELLAAQTIIVAGQVVEKAGAQTSLVIETPILSASMATRIQAHSNILVRLRSLWALATVNTNPALRQDG